MSYGDRPVLPAIVTTSASNVHLPDGGQDSLAGDMEHLSEQRAGRSTVSAYPQTPPRSSAQAAGGHSRSGSAQLTPPALFVTPSASDERDVGIHSLSAAEIHDGGLSTGGLSPSHNNSPDGSSTQYPPSPTLSSASSASPAGHARKLSAGTTPAFMRGHSPTKSVDSSFHTYLDTLAVEHAKGQHSRRPSAATDPTVFSAIDGPRAKEQIEDAGGAGPDLASKEGVGAGGVEVVKGKPKGFLGKIPLLKRFAKREEAEPEIPGDKKEPAVALPDPTPQEMGPFADLPPSTLHKLIDPKSLEHLEELGGDQGIMEKLQVARGKGLSDTGSGPAGTSVEDRQRIYGANKHPPPKSKSLLQLMWIAYQDKVLLLLSVAAVVSLALGIYQDVGQPPDTYQAPGCPGPNQTCTVPQVDWVEGVAITVAILIVVLVGSLNDYQKELQFRKLNAQKDARNVKVIRDGSERLMSVYDVVVGDICVLEPGEIVPVDGVYLQGHNVKSDESSATGESDLIKKATFEECMAEKKAKGSTKMDPFLLSGSKISEGSGLYVVTAVGRYSFLGRILNSLKQPAEITPLQEKLNRLAEIIAKLGSAAGVILFASLMIRFFTQLDDPGQTKDDKAQSFIQILIIAVTIIVVAVPEGLPLAVTLALAFATKRMTKENLLVRVLGSCETMGTATVICTDKTGTLTQNKMSVVAGSIGVHLKFAERLAETKRTNANSQSSAQVNRPPKDFSLDITELGEHLSQPLKDLFNESIAINSTAFEGKDEHGNVGFVGSKTETALMTFAQSQGWPHYKAIREGAKVVEMVPFSSERKAMGVVVKHGDKYRFYIKGASEVLFKLSRRHVVVSEHDKSDEIETAEFDEGTTNNIDRTIIFYANQSLRTIALCYRDFESWPPAPPVDGAVPYDAMAKDLTMLGIVAIEDPLREGVTDAVKTAQGAGVAVKMCTGDNVLTARSIATQCGIYTPGGIIMEGPAFRALSYSQQKEIAPRLQVLARSSPEDKKLLVQALKARQQIVGVTGDGANDAPALKHANVGFAMGIAGTEVAKEASDIVLMDDNFASIVTAISWGRCVNDSVKKFLQFQISVNITAVILTYITAVASAEEESVLTAVQLLWVNLIMDTFAALALATDPADPENLRRQPDRKGAPLISADMWKMIVGQSIYQIAVALVLHFAGHSILGYHADGSNLNIKLEQDDNLKTLIFNQFVFCQIFNMLNARRLDRTLNILRGVYKNYWFMGIWAIMIGGQALIVNVGGSAFQVRRIGGNLWAISIIIGLISLPVGVLVRLIPTAPIERQMIRFKLLPDPNALPTVDPEAEEEKKNSDDPYEKLQAHLALYSNIRGGRLRASSIVKRSSKSKQLDAKHIYPTTLMAMVPSMVMITPGGGFGPGALGNPAAMEPSKSSQDLYKGKPELHPQTAASDPVTQRFLTVASAYNIPAESSSGPHQHQTPTILEEKSA